jgi:hypothetical protein
MSAIIREPTYDPVTFLNKINIFTIAVIGSFITWKLLNCLYINIYEPIVDVLVDSKETDKYYMKIGKYYVQLDVVFKEFIKWMIVVVFLMVMYNLYLGIYHHI